MNDASTAIVWMASRNKLLKDSYPKITETSLYKKISKKNLANVGLAQYMNALADKILLTQEMP